MIDELLKARIKHCKNLCLKLEEKDSDYVIDLIETLQQLLLHNVSQQRKLLCKCTTKILPDGNIQLRLCKKCAKEEGFA
tara:strand:- start:380 stop:616 length:237 start_codon:yes stop_codon:yes gene_type:complete